MNIPNFLKIVIGIMLWMPTLSCTAQSETQESKIKTDTSETVKVEETKIISGVFAHVGEIPTPQGFERIPAAEHSYAAFLRNQELKTENNLVYLYDGSLKSYQGAQFAVLKLDVGKRDLQQCADAVMRFRGEYLYQEKKYADIKFNFLSDGKPRYYSDYAKGNNSPEKFRKYMDYIFAYANTGSLKNELQPVANFSDMQIGDVLIQKGVPYGHAVTVMDMAADSEGRIIYMLSQSYMPAQDIHILKNPDHAELSPWYLIDSDDEIRTPQWIFYHGDLRRFK